MRYITHWNVFNNIHSESRCGKIHHLIQFINCKFYCSNIKDTWHTSDKHIVLIDIASEIVIDLETNNSVFKNRTFEAVC